jgi:cytoplasmic iron level regulating protein YaaA (DUF328/UPF0246 family)
MLIILSPSKTIDFHTQAPIPDSTRPLFSSQANALIEDLRPFSSEEIALRERVSLKIAFATRDYIHSFSATQRQGKPALFAFTGHVYTKLKALELPDDELSFAQEHLRIFSALYGILRPLDRIQPHRLDMNTNLVDNLYETWKEKVTTEVCKLLKTRDSILINLASAEYFKMLDKNHLPANCRIITPVFKQESNGKYTVNSLYAKQARGLMARFIIQNKISDPEHLLGFSEDGYYYRPELSGRDEWIYTRLSNIR